MLVIHVHIIGRRGNIEKTYDFLQNDGKEILEGCDVTIPYNEEQHYPMAEDEAIAFIRHKEFRRDH